jgi:hypothetical protein
MNEKLTVQISADIESLKAELKKAGYELKKFSDGGNNELPKVKDNLNSLGVVAKNVGSVMAAAFTFSSLVSFGKSVIDTTAEFQKLEAVLGNTLGSNSAAATAMKQIAEFASTTPFAVDELTSSFVKLANQGFRPTMDEMRSLGDLASSTGKSFDQLAEAALDAFTGEFERLKEFGIKAKTEGDKVTFTFKGVKTQVDNTSDSIKNYILSLGNIEGVSGGMAKISATLGGQLSNLGDSFTQLQNNIGQLNSGALFTMVSLLQKAVGYFTELTSKKLTEQKLAISVLINGEESTKIIEEYNRELSRIGEIKDKNKLNEHLKYINTNMQFYQQAMINETNAKQRDISFAYYNLFKEARKAANGQMKLILKDQEALNNKLAEKAAKNAKEQKFKETIKFKPLISEQLSNADVDLNALKEAEKPLNDFQAQTNLLNQNLKELEVIGGAAFTPIITGLTATKKITDEQIANYQNMVNLLGGALTSAFDAALISGQNFGQVLIKAIGDLIKRLLAAVATAAILSVILNAFTAGGAAAVGGFPGILKTLTGFNFGGNSTGNKVLSSVPQRTNEGAVSFEIRGDKLYGVLQNYNQRLNLLA